MKKNKIFRKAFVFLLYILIVIFFIAFNFQDTYVGSWNPQYIFNTNGQSLKDMAFADSLIGYIILRSNATGEGTILKTTNGGENWITSYHTSDSGLFTNLKLFNKDSCLICNAYRIYKTTNGGVSWSFINPPDILGTYYIYAFNFDTIWAGGQTGFNDPHLWLSTNGGINWFTKYQVGSGLEFDRIYFYNKRIGFCCTSANTYKTTNGGENWFFVSSEGYTRKIQFTDSLTGWKCGGNWEIKKTTDGGYTWISQTLPSGQGIYYARMYDFHILNSDTIWGCGGQIYTTPVKINGIIYKTTNGGLNWGYQLPDTNINRFYRYDHIKFINKKIGWAYSSDSGITRLGGVHTTTGGLDSTIYMGIKDIKSIISRDYILYQNYPNPFNSGTNIKYQIANNKFITLKVFDIIGKEISTLVNKKQNQGIYEIKFDGRNLSSGIYLYSLFIDGVRVDTKKIILIK